MLFEQKLGSFRSWDWEFWRDWAIGHQFEPKKLNMVAGSRSFVCCKSAKKTSNSVFCLFYFSFFGRGPTRFQLHEFPFLWFFWDDLGQPSWNWIQFCGGKISVCEKWFGGSHWLDHVVGGDIQQKWEPPKESSVYCGRVLWRKICSHSWTFSSESHWSRKTKTQTWR